eukprot:scaffold7661_cov45-Attheya_sp.AAC.2
MRPYSTTRKQRSSVSLGVSLAVSAVRMTARIGHESVRLKGSRARYVTSVLTTLEALSRLNYLRPLFRCEETQIFMIHL